MTTGQETDVTVTAVTPDDADNKKINVESSDDATVRAVWSDPKSAFEVTAIKAGSATLTWKSEDGGVSKQQTINVTDPVHT